MGGTSALHSGLVIRYNYTAGPSVIQTPSEKAFGKFLRKIGEDPNLGAEVVKSLEEDIRQTSTELTAFKAVLKQGADGETTNDRT